MRFFSLVFLHYQFVFCFYECLSCLRNVISATVGEAFVWSCTYFGFLQCQLPLFLRVGSRMLVWLLS